MPGLQVEASQVWDADPSTQAGNNQVTLTYNQAFTFKDAQRNTTAADNLVIIADHTVPLNKASVGIALSGKAAFLVQAQPNMTYVFTPKPDYWLTFGEYQQGTALNIDEVSNPQKLDFTGVYSLEYTLDQNNLWVSGIQ